MTKKTGLGKGLDALFGPTPEEEKMKENDVLKNLIILLLLLFFAYINLLRLSMYLYLIFHHYFLANVLKINLYILGLSFVMSY